MRLHCKHPNTINHTPDAHAAGRSMVDDQKRLAGKNPRKRNLRGQGGIDPTDQYQADKLQPAKERNFPHETDSSHSP